MIMLTKQNPRCYISLVIILLSTLILVSGCGDGLIRSVDDWKYTPEQSRDGLGHFPKIAPAPAAAPAPTAPSLEQNTIGLSAGGAKDINNFRENIKNNYLPLPTDITYEGLFYDYYFDIGEHDACNKLFCPSYSFAVTGDPFSDKEEYYLSVGLNSGMKESDFRRKKLNLVIVLDISGSMSSPFNRYYYDQFGNKMEIDVRGDDAQKSKIEIATKSVVSLLGHLNADDRFGMVLFNNDAFLAKPLNPVGTTDMNAIKDHILEISARGGTKMSAGMKMGTELFSEYLDVNQSEYENRIIFLTDAMPNLGETSEHGLLGMTRSNAGNRIYTTFIGIGVDFNTELIEYITKIRGANYYSVHSDKEFKDRMDGEFDYMVTPLVFNLELWLNAEGWKIEKVYGSPEANEATGELMKVNTLFPSKKESGETRGGLILLKLKKISPQKYLQLEVRYEDRNGRTDTSKTTVEMDEQTTKFFANSGIRKGILLSRYAALLKNWTIDEAEHAHFSRPWEPSIDRERGIIIPPADFTLGRWERQSLPLMVSDKYRQLFSAFTSYFDEEMKSIGDSTLSQELDILHKLSSYNAG